MTHIIESITAKGGFVVSRDAYRLTKPRSGDHVRWADAEPGAPLGRIYSVGSGIVDEDEALVCVNQGRAFMGEDYVAISGGPFRVVKVADLAPTFELHLGAYWTWIDGHPRADNGADFHIARPVFDHRPTT